MPKAIKKQEENTSLAIQSNEELAKLYKDNANVGAENLSGSLPLLKIHAAGRSRSNDLADGSKPNDGWFYYKPTKEQFETVDCHVLTISRGFRAEGFEGKQDVFNQILAGVIVNNDEPKPFLMYFTGLKLENLWKFGKEASAYTKAKPIPIPMFALKVRLSTETKASQKGDFWVAAFEILKDESGFPQVVTDEGEFMFLKEHVATVQATIDNLIASKSTEETIEQTADRIFNEPEKKDDFDVDPEEVEKASKEDKTEDIPF